MIKEVENQFTRLQIAFRDGLVGLVPMVAPSGKIVYAIGALFPSEQNTQAEFQPLAVIVSEDKLDGARPATAAELETTGHAPQRINGSH